jgi:hypothetical protein
MDDDLLRITSLVATYRQRPEARRVLRQVSSFSCVLALQQLRRHFDNDNTTTDVDDSERAEKEKVSNLKQRALSLLLRGEQHPLWRPPLLSNAMQQKTADAMDEMEEMKDLSNTTISFYPFTNTTIQIANTTTSLSKASSITAYKAALARLPSTTNQKNPHQNVHSNSNYNYTSSFCIVPIRNERSISSASSSSKEEPDLLSQDVKDLQRDVLVLNGVVYDGATCTYAQLRQEIVNVIEHEKHYHQRLCSSQEKEKEKKKETKDAINKVADDVHVVPLVLNKKKNDNNKNGHLSTTSGSSNNQSFTASMDSFARDILRSVNRTSSGGDAYDAIQNIVVNQQYSVAVPSSANANNRSSTSTSTSTATNNNPLAVTLDVGAYWDDLREIWCYGLRCIVQASIIQNVCSMDDPTQKWATIEGLYEKKFTRELGFVKKSMTTSTAESESEKNVFEVVAAVEKMNDGEEIRKLGELGYCEGRSSGRIFLKKLISSLS